MKKITLLFFLMLTSILSAQVSIGNGEDVSTPLPVNTYYGYTYSQSIYLASEINASGDITAIKYYAKPDITITSSNSWDVYIGHTDKSSFDDSFDYITVTEDLQKFSGEVSIDTDTNTVTVTFTEAFTYDGTSNIFVAVDENLAGYNGSTDDFYASEVEENRSIYFYDDATNPDPLTPPSAGFNNGIVAKVPNITFEGISQACPYPTNVVAENVTTNSVDISWTTGGATTWEVIVQDASLEAPSDDVMDYTTADATSLNMTDLESATLYNVYVRDVCEETSKSLWSSVVTFQTLCSSVIINDESSHVSSFEEDEPNCWEYTNEGTGNDWSFSTSASYVSDGERSLRYGYNGTNAANVWAYTRELELTAGDEIQVTFDYRVYSASYAEKLKVTIGTEKTVASQTTTLWDNNGGDGLTNTSFEEGSAIYTVETSGTYYVAFNCYSDANKWDLYVDNISVHIAPTCFKPSDIVIENVTNNSADVTWTTGGASNWQVLVQEASMEAPTSEATGFVDVADTAANTLTDLEENTEYVVYVRDNCGEEDGVSFWQVSSSFTTLFNCPAPTGVTVENVTNNSADITWTTGGSSTWEVIVQEASIEAPAEDATEFETVDTTAEYAATDLEENTEYVVYVRDNCGEENGVSLWQNSFSFTTLFNCPVSTEIVAENITISSADISWTTGGATSWKIIVQEASLDAPAEDVADFETVDTDAEYSAMNLTASTIYSVYIKDVCDADAGESLWTEAYNFQTDCDSYTVDMENAFTSSFEDSEVNCWDFVNEGTGNNWEIVNGNSSEGDKSLRYHYSGSNAANAWAYTRELMLTAGDVIEVKFDYKIYNATYPEKMKVTIGTEKSSASQSNVLWDNNGAAELTNTDYEEGVATYTVMQSGSYFVAFNCYSDQNQWDLFVDDISITVTEQVDICIPSTDVVASNITTQSADITWTTGGATSWEVIVVASSDVMPENGEVVDVESYAALNLTPDTEYAVYVRDICAEDNMSIWTEVYNFTTAEETIIDCNVPTNIAASNITSESADITWTTGGAFAWEVIVVASSEDMPDNGVVVSEESYAATDLIANTEYAVYVRDMCDANNMSEWSEVYNFTTAMIGVSENTIEGLKVYPNPIKDAIFISANEEISSVEVYNTLGQVVLRANNLGSSLKLDVSTLSNGTYTLKLTTKSTVASHRVIKK
ncbi:fibronectin type III domain-containing protein [Aureivirga sp. CE67]|uniref:fibronectin type III domain-containing protein n=1 Tax=Aureivirga sp. CE67 TaxID=1788983 RepID=UPI0018CABFD0|nr:fibronectin type III domain-containing protein [Aureivirga sp. CE67]